MVLLEIIFDVIMYLNDVHLPARFVDVQAVEHSWVALEFDVEYVSYSVGVPLLFL